MRYIMISDVHGEYDKMIDALNKVNFNKEQDTIVSVGDCFDRGEKSKEVLLFLMSCPNRILLWGNHDARLFQILYSRQLSFNYCDFLNGVQKTLESFTDNLIHADANILKTDFLFDDRFAETRTKLQQYFTECSWAVEFDDLIVTHGWLPVDGAGENQHIKENWREVHKDYWYDATWSKSQFLSTLPACYPEKPLLIGHWHAWKFRGVKSCNCSTWISFDKKLIAIDGCANWEECGLVNTYLYETNNKPRFYKGVKVEKFVDKSQI